MTNNNIPTGLSTEMIDALIANPGQVISKGDIHAATSTSPTQSIPIQGVKDLIPSVKDVDGNEANPSGQKVTKPNMAKNNTYREQEDARIRLEQERHAAELAELNASLDPKKLLASINSLNRKVNRLEKTIKELNSNG